MIIEKRFLLINGTGDCAWHQALSDAVAPLGELCTTVYKEAMQTMMNSHYDLIIVDSLAVENVSQFVSTIRARWPETRVVVVTASPTWRRARAAFDAGASDYIRKTHDRQELFAVLEAALRAQPSPAPRQRITEV
jgi:DNA-binding response OmpR family regulator